MSEGEWEALHSSLLELLESEGLFELLDGGQANLDEEGEEWLASKSEQAWSQLNGRAKEVGTGARTLFAATQLCLAISRGRRAEQNESVQLALSALRCVDMAEIVGGPVDLSGQVTECIQEILRRQGYLPFTVENIENDSLETNYDLLNIPNIDEESRVVGRETISPQEFRAEYFKTDTPVVLEKHAIAWPACKKWKRTSFWNDQIGHRTFPIELDNSATKHCLVEAAMTMTQFLTEYLQTDDKGNNLSGRVAYLAQHDIFDRFPKLLEDLVIPAECMECGGVEKANCWIGTRGTITPLHYDSYDNLLCQVVGYKYVRLFPRSQTPYLYVDRYNSASGTRSQQNVSHVDVENPDLGKFPDIRKAKYQEVVLGPGDVLFIPQRYWHYVRSLSTSISVNFWF